MNINHIIKLFEQGNVCICGEIGSGKDMLMSNVVTRRNQEYISNIEYPKKRGIPIKYNKLEFDKINCGGNTYKNFMSGDIKKYEYPYKLGTDVYISDVGVYLPAQFCNELNKEYKHIPTFMCLSRQIGECHVHINVQNLNRAWDKLREASRTYITCIKCKVYKLPFNTQLVKQRIRIYEKYESCIKNTPKLRLPIWAYLTKDKLLAFMYKLNYKIEHGDIKEVTLWYINKSSYNTHIFREMLKNGT